MQLWDGVNLYRGALSGGGPLIRTYLWPLTIALSPPPGPHTLPGGGPGASGIGSQCTAAVSCVGSGTPKEGLLHLPLFLTGWTKHKCQVKPSKWRFSGWVVLGHTYILPSLHLSIQLAVYSLKYCWLNNFFIMCKNYKKNL